MLRCLQVMNIKLTDGTFGLTLIALFLLPTVCDLTEPKPRQKQTKELMAVRTCHPITSELCLNLGYSETAMPNMVGDTSFKDAELTLNTFLPLVNSDCSQHIRYFLCSVYFPLCTIHVMDLIGPCRPLCEHVRKECEPMLKKFGFEWPPMLRCDRFHEQNRMKQMCMSPDELQHSSQWLSASRPNPVTRGPDPTVMNHPCAHVPGDRNWDNYVFVNRTERCALKCNHDGLWTESNRSFSSIWTIGWSVVAVLGSLFTLATFLLDTNRLSYPDRPVIYMALCQLLVAIGFLLRFVLGVDAVACYHDRIASQSLYIDDGFGLHAGCAAVFLLVYYFQMSMVAWWMSLCISLFLQYVVRCHRDTVYKHSQLFHVVSWGFPALQALAILVVRDIKADPLTGICEIGSKQAHTVFVLLPFAVYGSLGLAFIVVFLCFPLGRHCCFSSPAIVRRTENSFVRVTVFAVCFLAALTTFVGCALFEVQAHSNRKLNFEVAMLKIFMTLIVGMKSAVWIATRDTLRCWQYCFYLACKKGDEKPRLAPLQGNVYQPSNPSQVIYWQNERQQPRCSTFI